MEKQMDRSEILATICENLAESLVISKEDIQADSRLSVDLGADSLDLLDIIFSLEGHFDIKLRDSEIDQFMRAEFTKNLTEEGYIAEKDILELEKWLPALKKEEKKSAIMPKDIFSFITVESIVQIIERKLKEKT